MIVLMGDKTGTETVEEKNTADPYGDVALGVECAWPKESYLMATVEESAE
jgi:hypothetical protein